MVSNSALSSVKMLSHQHHLLKFWVRMKLVYVLFKKIADEVVS